MKTTYLLIVLLYVLPSIVGTLRLSLDKATKTWKDFFRYFWYGFIPVYNLVLFYFILKEFWKWDKVVFISVVTVVITFISCAIKLI